MGETVHRFWRWCVLPGPHRLGPPSVPEKKAAPGTFRRIVEIFKPYKGKVAFVGLLILVISAIGLINPLLIKVVFDDVILGDGSKDERLRLLIVVTVAMIAFPIINGLLGLWQTYTNNVVGQNVMQDLRNSLYAHLQHMHLSFFSSTRTGEIQSRLSNDVGGVQAVLTDTASSAVSNIAIALSRRSSRWRSCPGNSRCYHLGSCRSSCG